jgi:hypothetical protein
MKTVIIGVCVDIAANAFARAQQVACKAPVLLVGGGGVRATLDSIPAWSFNCDGLAGIVFVALRRFEVSSPVG